MNDLTAGYIAIDILYHPTINRLMPNIFMPWSDISRASHRRTCPGRALTSERTEGGTGAALKAATRRPPRAHRLTS